MQLYSGTTVQFIHDANRNLIGDKLKGAYREYFGWDPGVGEVSSWVNSSQFMRNVLHEHSLLDNMIVLEYKLPYSNGRIDCLLFGQARQGDQNVVLLELKQWSKVERCDIDGNVITFVGKAERMVPHPSIQVQGYHSFLKDFVNIFQEDVALSSCVYCHNYSRRDADPMFELKFQEIEREFPVFTKNDFDNLGEYLKKRISLGNGLEVFNRFSESGISPSKKLMDYTKATIQGNKAFHLIDEQITASNTILDRVKKSSRPKKKTVIIVRGGPGTGKSVIALNILSEIISHGLTVFHATGSAAFTSTLRRIVGTRASHFFKYFNSFTTAKLNELNVLICDEAHRIRKSSNTRYTRKAERSEIPQVEQLIKSAKVCIFFIDEYQIVRPDEIGSIALIKEAAAKFGADIFDFELKTQFRCSGSDGYLNWIDNTLGVRETDNRILTKEEKLEFKIFDNPKQLFDAIKTKNKKHKNSARLVAGFCWPWSDAKPNGTLVEDIVIGDFKATWEAKNTSRNLAEGIPKASLWAHDPNGVNQVGSIYTIQGFEFDYVGVIFGDDFVYDQKKKMWVGKPENLADKNVKRAKGPDFDKLLRNVYRVLLTRGMKGCYVYFMDKGTEEFFRTRIEV